MKILIIYPYFIEDRIHREEIEAVPMGVYSIGAVLKEHGYEAEILNWYDTQGRPDEIQRTLREKSPDVIGLSILHANRWGGVEIARMAKKLDPDVRIVFGGIGATFLYEHFLKHFQEVDFVVLGEGEYTFLDLIRSLEKGEKARFGDIPGIAYRKEGKIIRTRDREPIHDLDELPLPSRYFRYRHVSSTRGCAWNCAYCGSPAFWGGGIRFRSPRHFVDELELLYGEGEGFFYISDDTFTVRKGRVIEICRQIIDRGLRINWYAVSRVDCVDEEILLWMRKAGCIQISYGIESGSEKIRNRLNKKIGRDGIRRAFTLTTKYGILPRAYFIYGSPGETLETIQETLDLIREIKPLGAIFYILDIFPGTGLYDDLRARTGITDDIWLERMEGLMYFETDPGLSDQMMLDFGEKLRAGFHEGVHSFAQSIDLIEEEGLYEHHSDFCSRLAMTFSHGDYSRTESIRERDVTAARLYEKSLDYCPNHRAYLGLGAVRQKSGEFRASVEILEQGLEHFPDSEELNLCLGISYMNMGEYENALSSFSRCPDSNRAGEFVKSCMRALNRSGS